MDRSLHRFVICPECVDGDIVRISGGDARQIATVLRLGVGDRIAAVDGRGSAVIVSLTEVSSAEVLGSIVQWCPLDTEPRVKLTVAQSLPKGDRLEFIIQKGTELGVAEFEVLTTARTIARPPENRVDSRLARWRAIAKEAAEQSCRAIVPGVAGLTGLSELVKRVPEFDLTLCLWESEQQASIRDILRENPRSESVLLIIGPEGGLEEGEVRLMQDAGASVVTLGPRVLRCETAAIAGAAIVIYELD